MRLTKGAYVYIMANENNTKVYTGLTTDLGQRVNRHKSNHFPDSYSAIHHCYKLVYYMFYPTLEAAIAEENRIKGGSRNKKNVLISRMNPDWRDLSDALE